MNDILTPNNALRKRQVFTLPNELNPRHTFKVVFESSLRASTELKFTKKDILQGIKCINDVILDNEANNAAEVGAIFLREVTEFFGCVIFGPDYGAHASQIHSLALRAYEGEEFEMNVLREWMAALFAIYYPLLGGKRTIKIIYLPAGKAAIEHFMRMSPLEYRSMPFFTGDFHETAKKFGAHGGYIVEYL